MTQGLLGQQAAAVWEKRCSRQMGCVLAVMEVMVGLAKKKRWKAAGCMLMCSTVAQS
jgi:hypothetical protein